MLTKKEFKEAQQRAAEMIRKSGIKITEEEPNKIEVVDFGHALQSLEIPADSAAFWGATGKLSHVHINDN